MAEENVPTQCDHCGQVDTDPKSHWNTGKTFHLDCLPFDLRKEFEASHEFAAKLVSAAHDGIRGAELKAFSDKIHSEGASA